MERSRLVLHFNTLGTQLVLSHCTITTRWILAVAWYVHRICRVGFGIQGHKTMHTLESITRQRFTSLDLRSSMHKTSYRNKAFSQWAIQGLSPTSSPPTPPHPTLPHSAPYHPPSQLNHTPAFHHSLFFIFLALILVTWSPSFQEVSPGSQAGNDWVCRAKLACVCPVLALKPLRKQGCLAALSLSPCLSVFMPECHNAHLCLSYHK